MSNFPILPALFEAGGKAKKNRSMFAAALVISVSGGIVSLDSTRDLKLNSSYINNHSSAYNNTKLSSHSSLVKGEAVIVKQGNFEFEKRRMNSAGIYGKSVKQIPTKVYEKKRALPEIDYTEVELIDYDLIRPNRDKNKIINKPKILEKRPAVYDMNDYTSMEYTSSSDDWV